MNPDEYKTPSSRQPVASSEPAWFQEIASPEPSSTQTPHTKKKPIILAGVIVLVLIVGLSGLLLLHSQTKSGCFDKNNYAKLMQIIQAVDNDQTSTRYLSPGEILYTENLYFADNSNQFTADSPNPQGFLQSIGLYYKENHATAPFIVKISKNYLTGDTAVTATQHIAAIKEILLHDGIAASAIQTEEPKAISTEDATTSEDIPMYMSIIPESNCQTT